MATTLASPVTVTQGLLSAAATHAQFRMASQNGNEPPMITHEVLGQEDAVTGRFVSVEGTRSDTGKLSTQSAIWLQSEYDAFAGSAKVQEALAMAKEMHDYIASGRGATLKPAWLP